MRQIRGGAFYQNAANFYNLMALAICNFTGQVGIIDPSLCPSLLDAPFIDRLDHLELLITASGVSAAKLGIKETPRLYVITRAHDRARRAFGLDVNRLGVAHGVIISTLVYWAQHSSPAKAQDESPRKNSLLR